VRRHRAAYDGERGWGRARVAPQLRRPSAALFAHQLHHARRPDLVGPIREGLSERCLGRVRPLPAGSCSTRTLTRTPKSTLTGVESRA
jgi:hypothetical protein